MIAVAVRVDRYRISRLADRWGSRRKNRSRWRIFFAVARGQEVAATTLERFERFWVAVIDSFAANRQVWSAIFDIFTVATDEK